MKEELEKKEAQLQKKLEKLEKMEQEKPIYLTV